MFDKESLRLHQTFIAEQEPRKAAIGKVGYGERKFWEEARELLEELQLSLESGEPTSNLVNELGDFLFCLLGKKELADQLQARLVYDQQRAEDYKLRDLASLHPQGG